MEAHENKKIKVVRRKNTRIELFSKNGLPLKTELKIDGKEIQNSCIVRYKETHNEKQLIVVIYDQSGHEHQMFYNSENDINIDYTNETRDIRLLVKDNQTVVLYHRKDITKGIKKLLCQLEIPFISSLELIY